MTEQKTKNSFVFYRSFYESLIGMDKESQADCLMAISDYALNGTEPELTPEVKMFFTLVKPQIDANNKRFDNGCKGGRPKNQTITKTKPKDNQTITEQKPNDNVNDNDNVNLNDNVKLKYIRPTLDDVVQYCRERNNNIDANEWYDYYSANGWKVGRNPMKDWKACVRYWEQKHKEQKGFPKPYQQEDDYYEQERKKKEFLEKLGIK